MITRIRKRSKISLVLIICMVSTLLSVSIPASAQTSGEYTYSVNADNVTCTITKYNGAGGDIVIPSTLDTYLVTVIGEYSFRNNLAITRVSIPDSVISIEKYAFLNAEKLVNITIPKSVTTIGTQALSNCYLLSSITIPNSVTQMGYGVFIGSRSLSSVNIPNSLTSIEGGTFQHCKSLVSVSIPSSVTAINDWAFSECDALENVTIPNSVTSIGVAAFAYCDRLKSITIPNSVMSIDNSAFQSCPLLASVYVDGTPSIGTNVFFVSSPVLYSPTGQTLSGLAFTAVPNFTISVDSTSNGTIVPSASSGMKDETISLQLIPEAGYTATPGSLKYDNGSSEVPIINSSFLMPDTNIIIKGGFEKIPVPTITGPSGIINNQPGVWSWTSSTGEGYYRYKLNNDSWRYTMKNTFEPSIDLTNGSYTLYVQEINSKGDWSSSAVSNEVIIDRAITPVIHLAPVGVTVNQKDTATLSVGATTTNGTLSYQWYKNTTFCTGGAIQLIDGIGSTYSPSTATAGTTYYYCNVTSTKGTSTAIKESNMVAVTVTVPSTPPQTPIIPPQTPIVAPQTPIWNDGSKIPSLENGGLGGWDEITKQIESMKSGNITINLNGTTIVPKNIWEALQGKEIVATFQLNKSLAWVVNGKNITTPKDINLEVTLDTDHIPKELVMSQLQDAKVLQISLAYKGDFGFDAALWLQRDKSMKGTFANLYYYNPKTGKLELQTIGRINQEGIVELDFTHASDYVISLDEGNVVRELAGQIALVPSKKTLYLGGTKGKAVMLEANMPVLLEKAIENGVCQNTITYKSVNVKVATVSASGKITAKKKGKATIITTVTTNGITRRYKTIITVKNVNASAETGKIKH